MRYSSRGKGSAVTDSSPRWYVDRSIPDHAVVTLAGKPSVGRCLTGSATGQLQPFAQRQIVASGVQIPFAVAGGFSFALFGGVAAATVLPFPFSVIAAVLMFGVVVVGQRSFDAISVRWHGPDMVNGGRCLDEYARMASAEVRRRELDRRAGVVPGEVRRRYPSLLFPQRTVWGMRESGNVVAQFAAQKLNLRQPGPDAVGDAFERRRYAAWEACADACGGSGEGVFAVEGAAHAVFGGALSTLPDEDLLALAPLVSEQYELESRLSDLASKIERAERAGADADYPEVAGAMAEVAALREQVDRIEEIYEERLIVAQDEAELSRLSESERAKADRQERALRDLSDLPTDDE